MLSVHLSKTGFESGRTRPEVFGGPPWQEAGTDFMEKSWKQSKAALCWAVAEGLPPEGKPGWQCVIGGP